MGKAEELAAAVEALGKRKRRNYPSELRQQIADHVREQRSAGVPLKTICCRAGWLMVAGASWLMGITESGAARAGA